MASSVDSKNANRVKNVKYEGVLIDGQSWVYQGSSNTMVPGDLSFGAIADTGAVVDFTQSKIFNTDSSPETNNLTDNLTGAKLGVVQKVYHNNGTAPTVPAGWVLMGEGEYVTSALNAIFVEWTGGTRVEYWITQEQ